MQTDYKEKARKPSRIIGLGIAATIIAALLSGTTFYFQHIKGSYEKNIENIRKTYLSLSKNAAAIEASKQQRGDFYKRRYYFDFPFQYSYSTANFLRRLSLIAPKEIEFIDLEMNPAPQSFTFLLSGRVRANTQINTQSKFLEFYQEIKLFDDLLHIDSSHANADPDKKESHLSRPNTPDQSHNKTKPGEFFFTISGEVEIETE